MAKVGTAEFEVELRRAKVKAEVDKIGQDIEKGLGDAAKKASDEIDRELSRKREIAGAVLGGGTLLMLDKAAKASSDLNEAQQAVRATFGGSAAAVEEFAAAAAKIGLSKQEALDATSTFGAMFVQLGVGTDQAAGLSEQIVRLGADFASFRNADITDVLDAQSAAFRGEYDALQRFVPVINAAAVEQQALAETGKASAQELTAQEKALATWTLMIQNAGPALGDFARNQDSVANSARQASAEMKNNSADIGQALQPAYAAAYDTVSALSRAFSSLPDGMQTTTVAIGGLAGATVLLAPRVAETVALMKAGGSKARQFGADLIAPSRALDGVGGAADAAAPRMRKFGLSLGTLAGIGIISYELIQLGRAMGETSVNAEEALRATESELAKVAEAVVKVGAGQSDFEKFGRQNIDSLYAMRDATKAAGVEYPELAAAIKAVEAENARAAARTEDYASVATKAADANTDLTAKAKTAADALTEQSRAARDLFDAHRGVAASVESLTDAQDAVAEAHKGVADAERAVADAQRDVTDARKAVADAHKGVQDALRGVADAERAAADARLDQATAVAELAQAQQNAIYGTEELERANRDVTDAERALTDAQRESKLAQEDLTLARDRAKESLDDMARSAEGAALAEESARLGLREAQERLANLGSDGRDVSSTERERAQLAVELADLALREAIDRNEDTAAKLAEMQAKGIEGSDEVVDAQGRITEATDAEAEAKDRLTEAQDRVVEVQAELAQAVEDAALRVEEANRRVEEADWRVIEAHYAVRDASDRVAEAQDRVRDAQQRVVDQRDAVVEARKAVKDAEDDVALAALGVIEAQKEVDEKTRGASDAIWAQIGRLGELADTLDPNNPLRQHLRDYTGELLAANAQAQILNAMEIALGGEGSLPRRAGGGRVNAGQPYLVNDASGITRPEVFVPDAPGRVFASENEWRSQQGRSSARSGGITIENINANQLTLEEAIQFVPRAIAHDLLVASP